MLGSASETEWAHSVPGLARRAHQSCTPGIAAEINISDLALYQRHQKIAYPVVTNAVFAALPQQHVARWRSNLYLLSGNTARGPLDVLLRYPRARRGHAVAARVFQTPG